MAIKKNTKKAAAGKTRSAAKKTIKPVQASPTRKSAPVITSAAEKNKGTASAVNPSAKGSREQKIQKIKSTLLEQRAALLSEAEVALNELPGVTLFPDMGDQASAETDMNFMLRLRGREQRLLKKIDEAIDRIDGSTFGICDDCGNEIDIKRLEARPVTTMCIECKTLQEEEEKRREV